MSEGCAGNLDRETTAMDESVFDRRQPRVCSNCERHESAPREDGGRLVVNREWPVPEPGTGKPMRAYLCQECGVRMNGHVPGIARVGSAEADENFARAMEKWEKRRAERQAAREQTVEDRKAYLLTVLAGTAKELPKVRKDKDGRWQTGIPGENGDQPVQALAVIAGQIVGVSSATAQAILALREQGTDELYVRWFAMPDDSNSKAGSVEEAEAKCKAHLGWLEHQKNAVNKAQQFEAAKREWVRIAAGELHLAFAGSDGCGFPLCKRPLREEDPCRAVVGERVVKICAFHLAALVEVQKTDVSARGIYRRRGPDAEERCKEALLRRQNGRCDHRYERSRPVHIDGPRVMVDPRRPEDTEASRLARERNRQRALVLQMGGEISDLVPDKAETASDDQAAAQDWANIQAFNARMDAMSAAKRSKKNQGQSGKGKGGRKR